MFTSKLTNIENLLSKCSGIEVVERKDVFMPRNSKLFKMVGTIVVPPNTYIEITSTATKGTIGKLVNIEFTTTNRHDSNNNVITTIDSFSITYIIEIDGRPKSSRISCNHAIILKDYNGNTKWVRNVNKLKKEVISNPINKFKQTLNEDDWIIGTGIAYGAEKPLKIGKVTRWTKDNIWGKTISGEEFKFGSIKETFLLPKSKDTLEEYMMMAIVKGWDGN